MFEQNQEIFNILFEAVSEGVIVVDKDQKIVAINTSAEMIFGYENTELINQKLDILIPKKYHKNHLSHFADFMKKRDTRKIGQGRELSGVKKNNKEFPLEIGLNPFDIDNETYVMALVIDITERKKNDMEIERLNAQLESKIQKRTLELNKNVEQLKDLNLNYLKEIERRVEAERLLTAALKKEIELSDLKSKFLSLVSHEFKTPLSGILTSAILLEKYKLSEEQDKRDKHIKTISNKVLHLNNILNDFLSIDRLDSGKINYKLTTFNLSKVINEVVYSANMLLKSGQKINIPLNVDEFTLYQDEKILELALSNLLLNAIKYSPENTEIDIGVTQREGKIYFKIIDEGIGIPAKDQEHIFDRYFRAENVLNYQGTGIGLSIAKVHIENLGGNISFKSKENTGSTFIIELPLNKPI
ncbi:MAG: PAS domain S-box protein [Bacteroidia bacterium]|nr:PAS domain S-box protein [Bacteroidia bacterium]